MKSILYAGVAIVALTVTAAAADLTYEPAPAPMATVAPVFDWTGFYVGVHGGGAWGNYQIDGNNAGGSADGALGGAQVGYNYQVDKWVFGIQTDLAYTGIKNNSTLITGYGVNNTLNWLGTTTVRAGYAMDTWLFYAKGGFAYGDNKTELSQIGASKTAWETGWTVGGGVEKAFTKNITGLIEYDYVDLGKSDFTTIAGTVNSGLNTSIVKVGLNYKF